MDDNIMQFTNRTEFRAWLEENCQTASGIWLLFGKAGGPETLTAGEALEEALCFGWIDGVMKKMDDTSYKKYFAPRRAGSKWSQKNKALVQELEAAGIEYERHYYELMRSLPVQASVTVKKSGEPDFNVEAIAAVYSGEAHGLTGELVWD